MLEKFAGYGYLIGLISYPILIIALPWYILINSGKWFPLLIIYGSALITLSLYLLNKNFIKEKIYSD